MNDSDNNFHNLSEEDQKYLLKINKELGNFRYRPKQYNHHSLQFYEKQPINVYEIVEDFQKLEFEASSLSSPSSSPSPPSTSLSSKKMKRYLRVPSHLAHSFPPKKQSYLNSLIHKGDLPPLPSSFSGLEVKNLRIIVISDTHDRHHLIQDHLPPCDLLIHCGDILMKGRLASDELALVKYRQFNDWMTQQPARYKLVIGGNHDYHLAKWSRDFIESAIFRGGKEGGVRYLCNDLIEIEGLRIFATPLSSGTSRNRAFQDADFFLDTLRKWREICSHERGGGGVDVLISHSISEELLEEGVPQMAYLFGHVHEYYGLRLWPTTRKESDEDVGGEEEGVAVMMDEYLGLTSRYSEPMMYAEGVPLLVVNSSLLDANYEMKNQPIILDLSISSSSSPSP